MRGDTDISAASHFLNLTRSTLPPNNKTPNCLNLYWSSLTVFNLLATLLPVGGRRTGVDLTRVIMATDLIAHPNAAYGIQLGLLIGSELAFEGIGKSLPRVADAQSSAALGAAAGSRRQSWGWAWSASMAASRRSLKAPGS
ncbi:hypothetical protein [Streptomyces griseoviridis]|uniref:hypothetical protein n=1 Tax=Streptomyces griseoviridis TaxID=45398 RepID=UPI0034404BA1